MAQVINSLQSMQFLLHAYAVYILLSGLHHFFDLLAISAKGNNCTFE